MLLTLGQLRRMLRESAEASNFALDAETDSIFADPVAQAVVQDMRRRGWFKWPNFRDWEGEREELKDVPVGWWIVHWYADPSCTVTEAGVWAIGEVLESWIEIGEMTLKVKFLNYVRSTGIDDEFEVRGGYVKEIYNWLMVPDAVMQGSALTAAMADLAQSKTELDWRPAEHLPEDDYSL